MVVSKKQKKRSKSPLVLRGRSPKSRPRKERHRSASAQRASRASPGRPGVHKVDLASRASPSQNLSVDEDELKKRARRTYRFSEPVPGQGSASSKDPPSRASIGAAASTLLVDKLGINPKGPKAAGLTAAVSKAVDTGLPSRVSPKLLQSITQKLEDSGGSTRTVIVPMGTVAGAIGDPQSKGLTAEKVGTHLMSEQLAFALV